MQSLLEKHNTYLFGNCFDRIADGKTQLQNDSYFFDLNKELGLIAEICLSTSGTHNQYEGHLVKVIHKINGEISRHYFNFNNYFEKYPIDNLKWYISKGNRDNWNDNPPNIESMQKYRDAIILYLMLFKG
jgi:hypothetical protein